MVMDLLPVSRLEWPRLTVGRKPGLPGLSLQSV